MDLNKLWINLIKGSDRNITFLGFLSQNKQEFVKAIVKNDLGGKDTVIFKCTDGFANLRSNEWEEIRKVLKNKTYLEQKDEHTADVQ